MLLFFCVIYFFQVVSLVALVVKCRIDTYYVVYMHADCRSSVLSGADNEFGTAGCYVFDPELLRCWFLAM